MKAKQTVKEKTIKDVHQISVRNAKKITLQAINNINCYMEFKCYYY